MNAADQDSVSFETLSGSMSAFSVWQLFLHSLILFIFAPHPILLLPLSSSLQDWMGRV